MNDRTRHSRALTKSGGIRAVTISGPGGLLLATMLLGGCKSVEAQPDSDVRAGSQTAKPQSAQATRVEVAVINPSAADLVLALPAEVEASRDAQLAAALGGFVERVNVKSGDEVHKGQILAQIDSATHVARRNQAKVELDAAKRELKRVEKLRDTLPGAQLDAAQSRFDMAKAAYRTANVAASRSVISAPFAGVVAQVDIEVGEVAPPGVPLIRVVQLDPIKVTVSLSDRDVLSISEGMKATISTDARGALLEGTVAHIHPAADLRTRAFVADIEVDNAERKLLPGMIASVQLKADVADEQIVIAQDWLVTRPDELGVFVHQDQVARWRSVKVGSIVRNKVVILGGLKAGDELVVTGHRELAEGDPLLVARRGACCTDGRVVFPEMGSKKSETAKPAGSAATNEATAARKKTAND